MTFDLCQHKYQINCVTRYKGNADCLMERLYYTVIQYGCNRIYHRIKHLVCDETTWLMIVEMVEGDTAGCSKPGAL